MRDAAVGAMTLLAIQSAALSTPSALQPEVAGPTLTRLGDAVNATSPTATTGRLSGCTYEPSTLELQWTSAPAAGRICEIASSNASIAGANAWLAYSAGDRSGAPPDALSRWTCPDGRVEYIEPLVGIARHPFAKVGCELMSKVGVEETEIFNITYLVLADECGAESPSSSNRHFYDLGCTVWGDGQPIDLTHGGDYSPSLPLFDGMYAQRCLPLTRLFGWELTDHDPKLWWEHVPASARARLNFFNIPIEEDFASNASFSTFLQSSAVEDDFVSVKVDIDYVPVEKAIVTGIARRPELTRLVDELFFEYHFNFDELDFGWHSQTGAPNHVEDTVDDALALMSELRRAGVRSHFWI